MTLLQRLIASLTGAIDKAAAEKSINLRQKQSLYRSLLHLLMGEPYILSNLAEFAQEKGKGAALEHLFKILGRRCKRPQALNARIVQSVSLKNVQRTWNITKSDSTWSTTSSRKPRWIPTTSTISCIAITIRPISIGWRKWSSSTRLSKSSSIARRSRICSSVFSRT